MGRAARAKKLQVVEMPVLRLDFGCGPNKREGFQGVDRIAFPGVDHVLDIGTERWPWADGSVLEAHASHFVEHLTAAQRVHFVNELYRVLIPGGTCQVIVPHWASCRAYGDPTHQWPPVSEFWFQYLFKPWRDQNAPHTDVAHNSEGYACHFDITYGYSLRADLLVRSHEVQMHAVQTQKEACQDILATFKKLVLP
jgi:hypothetical protein